MKRLWLSTLLCFLFFIVYPLAAERLPNYDYYSERFFQTATESLVRRKIADGSIRQYGQNLSIVLWKAIQYNRDPKVIKAILDGGAVIFFKDDFEWNPLHYAAVYSSNPEVYALLIAAKVRINEPDIEGKSPLLYAVIMGQPLSVIKVLTKAGARINQPDDFGNTPLYKAVANKNYTDVIQHFIIAGTKVNAANAVGSTPLMGAVMCQPLSIIKILIAAGADLDYHYSGGKNLLMLAIENDRQDGVLHYLLAQGISADEVDASGRTALMIAVLHASQTEVLSLLVHSGCEINARDTAGRTALMLAAREGNPLQINFLLDNGADGSLSDQNGFTAFDYAFNNLDDFPTPLYQRLKAALKHN